MDFVEPVLRSATLREQAYDRIRVRLRSGRFRPGQRVTEVALAASLDVSRTPVREALGLLSREGLLDSHPRGGFAVPSPSPRDIDEIFEIRRRLEPYAAAQAAERATVEGVAVLRDAVKEGRGHLADDGVIALAAANAHFRAALFAMAGNARLARCIETFDDHVQYVRHLTWYRHSVRRTVISGQLMLLDAVRRRDAAGAAAGMNARLDAERDAVIAVLDDEAAERPGS